MSVEGLCSICEASTADFSCDRCGRLVCDTHYSSSTGFCTECHAETGRPANPDTDENRPDGVDEYQF